MYVPDPQTISAVASLINALVKLLQAIQQKARVHPDAQ